MDERSALRAPAWTTIAFEQIQFVALRLRVAGVALLALGMLVSAAFVWYLSTWGSSRIALRKIALTMHHLNAATRATLLAPLEPVQIIFAPEISIVIVLLALLMPLALWQDEPPGQRGYHLAMPLSSSTHTLLRVLAGWFWMMVITALYLAAYVTVPKVVGFVPDTLPIQVHYMVWWEWVVPFTAVTVAYLFASAAAVGARRPLVWIGGIPILYMGCVTLLLVLQRREAAAVLQGARTGFYGVAAAMAGQIAWTAGAPSLSRWLGATAIWGILGAALLFSLTHRRAEA